LPRLTEARALKHKLPPPGVHKFIWDNQVRGFAARITSGGSRSYIVQTYHRGRKVRLTIGAVGVMPFIGKPGEPGAKDLAIAAILAARKGEDPREAIGRRHQAQGLTVAELWGHYERAGFPHRRGIGSKRASTIVRDLSRYRLYIAPRLGRHPVSTLDRATVRGWLDRIPGRGQRGQCLILIKSLLSFCAERGLASVNEIAIRPAKSRTMQTFLTPAELRALRAACSELIAEQPERAAGWIALQVLIDTGARLSEILSALRANFNPAEATLRLVTTKNSLDGRTLLLSPGAMRALASLPLTSSPYLFPSRSRTGHMVTLAFHFRDALARAGLPRIRLHDLRHSYASASINAGVSLFVTGALLGHRDLASTKRYAHLEDAAVKAALARVHAAIHGEDR
jgi:site-specific recombinase XerD